ncbi:MAG: PD-(D/E)XK nuclease family protein [Bacilli bacterium]|nr:PD-(D/E)XK nuclease family protein [Bacilli bacterium]
METFVNHCVVVCPEESKDLFLSFRRRDPHKDFSLYSREDLEGLLAYQYDDRALVSLLKKGHGYSLAKDELKWLSKLRAPSYASPKLNGLVALRDELVEEGLIWLRGSPERAFLNREIYVYGYADTERIERLLRGFSARKPHILPPERANQVTRKVREYEDVFDETRRLFNEICHDVESGTRPDDIYILGADESYFPLFRDYGRYYGVAVERKGAGRLYDRPIFRAFKEFLKEGTLQGALDRLGASFPLDPDLETIRRFATRFAGVRGDGVSLYEEIARASLPKTAALSNLVHLQASYYPRPGAHLYLVNCALGVYPKSYRDSDFLSDAEKKEAGLPVSSVLNRERLAELSALLKGPQVRFLSLHERYEKSFFLPASFTREEGYEIVFNEESPYEYSSQKGAFYLCSLLDKKRKYLYEDPSLAYLAGSVTATYDTYRSGFTPFASVDPSAPRSYSYSALKSFLECPFRYYLERVLGLNDRAPSFASSLGNVFHAVMEAAIEPGFDFEASWAASVASEAASNPFSAMERTLLEGDKPYCLEAVKFHRSHFEQMERPSFAPEKTFRATVPDRPLVGINGRIDLAIETGERGYLTLLDYKTSDRQYLNQALVPLGFSLQLPFYAYACSIDPDFSKRPLLGLFIADILPGGPADKRGEKEDFANGTFPLRGVFLADPSALRSLDPLFVGNDYIKGYSYAPEKGFSCRSNANGSTHKSAEELNAFGLEAKKRLLDSDAKIRRSEFQIAPKKVEGEVDACEYCPYRDVCFRKEEDYVRLKKPEKKKPEERK